MKSLIIFLGILASFISGQATFAKSFYEMSLQELLNVEVETASLHEEPQGETPSPVTIITEEMIKESGVKTLKDAVTLFVPGFMDVEDRNEYNIAYRGIYATSQQKILILLNGHRLNSRSYSTAIPDHGISLHNLKKIEVLRGPGSSLYGNVALSGVINLITKQGKNSKDFLEASYGNHEQKRLRFLAGEATNETDILIWGQVYSADGEKHHLNGNEPFNSGKQGSIFIDAERDPVPYDWGLNYRHKNTTLLFNISRSKKIEPYGSGNKTYDFSGASTINGGKPGLEIESKHLSVSHEINTDNGWKIVLNPYLDTSQVSGGLALGASFAGDTTKEDVFHLQWNDYDFGLKAHASKEYNSNLGRGHFLVGAHFDYFSLIDSETVYHQDGVPTAPSSSNLLSGNTLLDHGNENNSSTFMQLKHHISTQLISNIGFRYDSKRQQTGNRIENFSPRVALIYKPTKQLSFNLSYAESFVGAPYWYRHNNLVTFLGSSGLQPEEVSTTQLEIAVKGKSWRNSTVIYKQKGKNFLTSQGVGQSPVYINSGLLESHGLENTLSTTLDKHRINHTFQIYEANKSKDYSRAHGAIDHIPQVTSSLIYTYSLFDDFLINTSLQYFGKQFFHSTTTGVTKIDSALITNLGARMERISNSKFYADLRIYNLFDTERFQGGQTGGQIPYRRPGRWLLGSIGYHF